MKQLISTIFFSLFLVLFVPNLAHAVVCSSYSGASCVNIMDGCVGNPVPTEDCSLPQVCCVPTDTAPPTCSSLGGIAVTSCVGGTVVPASGVPPGEICCILPTCSSLGGSCVTGSERTACTDAGGTVNTTNNCADLNPSAPYCCIPEERATSCTVPAPTAGQFYNGTCVDTGTCAAPKQSQTGAECIAGQICCYEPIEEAGCVASGGTCTDSCGDGQISNPGLYCSDEFATCCLPNTGPADTNFDDGGLVPCSGVDIVDGRPVPSCQFCHIVELINRVIQWLVGILTVIFAIIFVVGGYRMVTSAGNVSEKQAAKTMITNAVIGFVIFLAGWLIIDLLMKTLTGGSIGPWNEIECVQQPTSMIRVETAADVVRVYGETSPSALNNATAYEAGDCSPATLQGMGMSATQAQVFSCIAKYESNCNNNASAARLGTTARGIFQITRGYNTTCHNLNLPACTTAAQAAGWTGTGNLNCSQAFSGGRVKPGQEALANVCNAAASNQQCNVASAICLYNDEGGYRPWLGTASKPHVNQRACVQKYAN